MKLSMSSPHYLKWKAKLLTMAIRNRVESIHGNQPGDLSDAQMRKLNPLMRNAVFTILHALAHELESVTAERFLEYHLELLPTYWEEPELLPEYRDNLEPDVDGAVPGRLRTRDPRYQVALVVMRPMLERIDGRPEGMALRGREGRKARLALERYGVDRYLKLSATERKNADTLKYLEHDLTQRAKRSHRMRA